MRKLSMFNQVSLDGYFTDQNNNMSWAHKDPNDAEWNAFVSENASSGGSLLLGRITYEMMASFWPTPMAAQIMSEVAEGMNRMEKIVVSGTLKSAEWNNTRIISGNIIESVARIKEEAGPDIAILGSGTLVKQLSEAGLIDVYQFVIAPLALGAGRTLFQDSNQIAHLQLTGSRNFGNGHVLLNYIPRRK